MATIMSVIVTPAVCPRLIEFLTMLTFGAHRRKHIVSTPCETIAKKKTETKRLVVHVRTAVRSKVVS